MAGGDIRLTALAREGGCGGILAPAVLRAILTGLPEMPAFPGVRAGIGTGVAVHRLNAEQALVVSTEFITPLVDDPDEFGRIAAAHALSGIYAMGGEPVQALTLGGLPAGKLPVAGVQQILAGSAAVCAQAGIPMTEGAFADAPELVHGLVALGLVHPDRAPARGGARAGDVLILTKALGIGVFGAAFRRGALGAEEYRTMIAAATQPNAVGRDLPGVHAVTVMGGAGLLGDVLALCRAARLSAAVRLRDVPLLPGAQVLAQAGVETATSARNWDGYGSEVQLAPRSPSWVRAILCDPQTGGGLLAAVASTAVDPAMALLRQAGFDQAAVIGELRAGPARLHVR
jgi:selenide,water dikinase